MKIISSVKEMRKVAEGLRRRNQSIGFVPTMGYLHEGHLALVRAARRENDAVVVSIFVNPTQFGPHEDYRRYPRDLKRDKALLKSQRTDYLFAPSTKAMVPEGFQTGVRVGKLSGPLCGVSRPVHFGGVATVVAKLLNLVAPDRVYLGQKDYQQYKVVERMIRDLDFPVQARLVATVREKDGLAMSSRNVYLSAEERQQAPVLYRALCRAAALVRSGERRAGRVRQALAESVQRASRARIDYAEIVDAGTLEPVVKLKKGRTLLAVLAVFLGKTRLIDNCLVRVP